MPASPYKRGADDGMTFAIYLTALFFASIYSINIPFLSFVALILVIGVPFLIYRYLRKAYVADKGYTILSSLWMHGIMIFVCGSALSAVVQIIYLKWINPHYLSDMVNMAIDLYSEIPGDNAERMTDLLQKIVDNNMLPSAISVVMEMLWLSVFSGSLLSLLMSLLVRARPVKYRGENN